jgi:hypothetical protein
MRAKAEAFLESGGLVAVRKELSVESKCVSDPGSEILASLLTAAHVQESKPTPTEVTLFEDKVIIQEPTLVLLDTTLFEDVVVGKIKSESDTVMTSPVSEAVGMCNSLTMFSRQFMVAVSVAAKSVSHSGAVNPVSILLGKVLCIGKSFLRVDDKPPDPGKPLPTVRGNDKSAQTCMTPVILVRICYHHEKNIEIVVAVCYINFKLGWAMRFQQEQKRMAEPILYGPGLGVSPGVHNKQKRNLLITNTDGQKSEAHPNQTKKFKRDSLHKQLGFEGMVPGKPNKLNVLVGKKRDADPMEVEETEGGGTNKAKGDKEEKLAMLAGLSEQPCKDQ